MGADAGECTSSLNNCKDGYFCPLVAGEESITCLTCSEDQPVGASCKCGTILQNCAQCNSEKCDLCSHTFFLKNEICESCGANCRSCTDEKQCQTCSVGYFLSGQTCEKCSESCITCSSINTCLTCKSDQYLTPESTCKNCSKNCTKCNAKEECEVCISNYYISSTFKCELCDIAMPEQLQCRCDTSLVRNCASCSGTKCISCISGYRLIIGSCFKDDCMIDSQCKAGQFCDISETSTNTCITCSSSCKACHGKWNQCISCKEGAFLSQNTCQSCSQESPAGSLCNCGEKQFESCGMCKDGECGKCIDGFTLVGGQCQKCQKNAPLGSVCTCGGDLLKNCASCSQKGCGSCVDNAELILGTCIVEGCGLQAPCREGQYCHKIIAAPDSCMDCASNCSSCLDIKSCEKCSPGHFKMDNKCVSCMLNDNQECNCDDTQITGCRQCQGNTCTMCAPGYSLKEGKCDFCKDITLGQECQCGDILIPNCAQCDTNSKCQLCVDGSKLVEEQCLECKLNPGICGVNMSVGSIIGIAVGSVAGLVIVCVIIVIVVKKSSKKHKMPKRDNDVLIQRTDSNSQLIV
ncbi:Cysteine-rich membrane protein 2 [Spironucleus salmonicida]|uniref:Cysteine-rich membrane protein 2 n=1 Tax=Spironucleus salmonicida TaxID=348837 RepID=V6LGV8_9EUKA|nr:Cysteine-rich membrane protein 2 [Spironucleus salmonicida]|eukprot:EST43543.1 Cysteine-rich membrane protein 2 [Spironucleus salmonicida]